MPRSFNESPYNLDWGNITPEGYNETAGEVIHVFNFDISSQECVDRCIVFSVGKIIWSSRHIPPTTKQKIVFDLRGQPITLINRARKMKDDMLTKISMTDSSIDVVVEILI